ncbi:MAG: phosphoribosylaminoimidazolesuccinocarboxamide synthase [Candidatus Sericytochromatia bacterium]|nr:phosphoribosylaminoimidazolesuccinocarboxamide synthase [Candidatus Sericytochromatia bacterium]
MDPKTGARILQGKTKDVYEVEGSAQLLLHFRDDVMAFRDRERAIVPGKGEWGAGISVALFDRLGEQGIPHHFVRKVGEARLLVERLKIFPFFIVARNLAAGSLAKRFGLEEGSPLASTIVEFYPKDPAIGKQWVNASHIRAFGWADDVQLRTIRTLTDKINETLVPYLSEEKGLVLVDFRLEFGLKGDQIMLANELSPDNLRLWDMATAETLDGDRFRQGVDQVKAAYYEIYRRICLNE